MTISTQYTQRENKGFNISFPPQVFKPEFMKCGLPSGRNRNFGSIRKKQLCVGVAVYIVEIDEKRFMDRVEE